MKKVLAIMIVMMLALSMAVTAGAAEAELDLTKVWTDETGAVLSDGNFPDVEITFEAEPLSAVDYSCPDYSDPDNIPNISVVKPAGSDKFVLSGTDLIDGIGVFTYSIHETSMPIAGATFDSSYYTVEIHRTYVPDGNGGYDTSKTENSQVIVAKSSNSTEKVDEIKNTYSVRNVTIDKTVTGNLSRKDQEFKVVVAFACTQAVETVIVMPDSKTVTLTQSEPGALYYGEAEFTISDGNGVKTITGVPEGVTVYLQEADCDPYTLVGYSLDGDDMGTDQLTFTISDTDAAVVITNKYETEIDTGISLDSLPYILILVAVGGAAVFFAVSKRRNAAEID